MRMKLIVPSPIRIRYISVRRPKKREKVLVGSFVCADVDRDSRRDAKGSVPESGHRDPGAFEARTLLLKEIEETNNWARLAFQLYFGWFALQFTVNGVAMGSLFSYKGSMPWFASLVFLVFIGWNLMGTIGTVLVYKGLVDAFEMMAVTDEDSSPRLGSPVPRSAISIMFVFCTVTMFMSLAFWVVVFIRGQ